MVMMMMIKNSSIKSFIQKCTIITISDDENYKYFSKRSTFKRAQELPSDDEDSEYHINEARDCKHWKKNTNVLQYKI